MARSEIPKKSGISAYKGRFSCCKFHKCELDLYEGKYFFFRLPEQERGLEGAYIFVEYKEADGKLYAVVWAQRPDVEQLRGLMGSYTIDIRKDEEPFQQIINEINNDAFIQSLHQFFSAMEPYKKQ